MAEAAALAMARRLGLENPAVINRRLLHPAEGSVFEIKGMLDVAIRRSELPVAAQVKLLPDSEIEAWARPRHLHVVAATVGEDEHSVGLREILDSKHGGIEKYGFRCHFLGTSVALDQVLTAAVATDACAVLISTLGTHGEVHRRQMRRLHELAVQQGIRERLVLIAGGTQITDDLARSCGLDAGFSRGASGRDVVSFLVRRLQEQPIG